jgi:hypothetical protein
VAVLAAVAAAVAGLLLTLRQRPLGDHEDVLAEPQRAQGRESLQRLVEGRTAHGVGRGGAAAGCLARVGAGSPARGERG